MKILVLLVCAVVFMSYMSNFKSSAQLSLEAMDNLEKKGLTIQDGFIMTNEDAKQYRREKNPSGVAFWEYVGRIEDELWDPNYPDKEFQKLKTQIYSDMAKDKRLDQKSKKSIESLFEARERTTNFYKSQKI